MISVDWTDLIKELDNWGNEGRIATFWWRDDDASAVSPALEILLEFARKVPLALAVIPGLATEELAARLKAEDKVSVLQHGWRHISHITGGKNEYPRSRPSREVHVELVAGRKRLQELFGDVALPVFVPPWHGFDDELLPILEEAGLNAISKKGERTSSFLYPRLFQANAHMAPIVWSDPPSLGDPREHLDILIRHLTARRNGRCDKDEPTGLLTHHLAQDKASWDLIRELVRVIDNHPSANWMRPTQVFGQAINT